MTREQRALRGALFICAIGIVAFLFVPLRQTVILFGTILVIWLVGGYYERR
jgi:diacylglycerol kinase